MCAETGVFRNRCCDFLHQLLLPPASVRAISKGATHFTRALPRMSTVIWAVISSQVPKTRDFVKVGVNSSFPRNERPRVIWGFKIFFSLRALI